MAYSTSKPNKHITLFELASKQLPPFFVPVRIPGKRMYIAGGLTKDQHALVSEIMNSPFANSHAYQKRYAAQATLRSGDSFVPPGVVMLEFYTENEDSIHTFLAYVHYSMGRLAVIQEQGETQ